MRVLSSYTPVGAGVPLQWAGAGAAAGVVHARPEGHLARRAAGLADGAIRRGRHGAAKVMLHAAGGVRYVQWSVEVRLESF